MKVCENENKEKRETVDDSLERETMEWKMEIDWIPFRLGTIRELRSTIGRGMAMHEIVDREEKRIIYE